MMARPCVLVVDDDPDFQKFLAVLLTEEGYDIAATDSVIGARVLARRVQPGAILLDLGLPYRTGASLLGELKADPRTAPIPVIVISGMPEVLDSPRRALAAGIIRKPFEAQTLLDALRSALQRPSPRWAPALHRDRHRVLSVLPAHRQRPSGQV